MIVTFLVIQSAFRIVCSIFSNLGTDSSHISPVTQTQSVNDGIVDTDMSDVYDMVSKMSDVYDMVSKMSDVYDMLSKMILPIHPKFWPVIAYRYHKRVIVFYNQDAVWICQIVIVLLQVNLSLNC